MQTSKVVLGCIAFSIFWVMAVFPKVTFLPIGRTAGTLLSASLMVVFKVLSPDEAFKSIDLPILALLFGTMIVGAYLERCDLFLYLRQLLTWRNRGGQDLLCRVCILAGIVSAVLTNDTTCVTLTPFILDFCHHQKLPPQPFLIALATSSNIGSAATPIGNPQNLIIAIEGKISFWKFLVGILPAVVLGLILNMIGLLVLYWGKLGKRSDVEEVELSDKDLEASEKGEVELSEKDLEVSENREVEINSQNQDREDLNSHIQMVANEEVRSTSATESSVQLAPLRRSIMRSRCFKIVVYLVTLGMLACFLAGLDLAWTAVTAGLVLMVLDFVDAAPILDKVSYSLLVFFSGMFISVEGFNATKVPEKFWNAVEPYSRINSTGGIAVLSLIITVLSNVASNVPTVLLLGPRLAASASSTEGVSASKAWLILAWVSTVAGNLTLLGSAANIIVSEQARRCSPYSYHLSFWNHLRYGFPSTLVIIAAGVYLVR